MLFLHPRRLEAATWDGMWKRWSIEGEPVPLGDGLLRRPLGVFPTGETATVACWAPSAAGGPPDRVRAAGTALELFSWDTLHPVGTLSLAEPVTHLAFTHEGPWLLGIAGEASTATLFSFDRRTGAVSHRIAVEGEVLDSVLDPLGRLAIVRHLDQSLLSYRLDEGRLLRGPTMDLGTEPTEEPVCFAFHPSPARVAVCASWGEIPPSWRRTGMIRSYDFATGYCMWTRRIIARSLAFSSDGRRLLCGDQDGEILILDALSGNTEDQIKLAPTPGVSVTEIAVHSVEPVVCALVGDRTLRRTRMAPREGRES